MGTNIKVLQSRLEKVDGMCDIPFQCSSQHFIVAYKQNMISISFPLLDSRFFFLDSFFNLPHNFNWDLN
jgi:hypothetical protein